MGLLVYLVVVVVLYQAKRDKRFSFLAVILRGSVLHYNKIYSLGVLVNRNRLLVSVSPTPEREVS